MEKTAAYAVENGFTHFTTTNATSRWKDIQQVNTSGIKAAQDVDGVSYLAYNWQTDAMTKRKYEINANESFYKQEYCGCSYSLRDSNAFRVSEGLPEIVIGGGGVYHDPEADAEEESLKNVASFFEHTHSKETEEWRKAQRAMKQRRKDARSDSAGEINNW